MSKRRTRPAYPTLLSFQFVRMQRVILSFRAQRGISTLGLLAILLSSACRGPSPEAIDVQAEQIAVPIIATYKASIPTPVAELTGTPAPSAPTQMPTGTPQSAGMDLAPVQVLNLAACCAGSDIYTIDPALAYWEPPAQIATEAFVGLTRQDEETAAVGPGMAEEMTVSDNGRVWTFQLRTHVPWVRYNPATRRVEQVTDSNGQVRYVTARDFEYGIKRTLDPATQADQAYDLYLIEGAEEFNTGKGPANAVGVEALDDSTLEMRLRQPATYFDAVASTPPMAAQPQWQIEQYGDEWTEPANFQAYGPYVLKEWVHNSHLTLIRNPHWPGTETVPQPTIEEITWTLMDDADAWIRYSAGDLDLVQVPRDELATVQADSELAAQLVAQPSLCTYYYAFNTAKPPFDDGSVRLAFSLAVDRQALVEDVLRANQEPAHRFSPRGLRAAPMGEEYPTLSLTYQPDQARSLLDEVYPDRSRMEPITLVIPSLEYPTKIADAIREMWADALGVEVQVEIIESYSDYLDRLDTDLPQVSGQGWCETYADAHYALQGRFHSAAPDPRHTSWSSGEFDNLIDEAAMLTDVAARTALYAQAEDILTRQEAAIIPLYWYTQNVLTRPYVKRTYSQIGGIEHFEKWAILAH